MVVSASEVTVVEARVCRYNARTSSGWVFAPGCFAASLERRMPRLLLSHDWDQSVGQAISFSDTDEHLDMVFELDDFERVPAAGLASLALQSGEFAEFSVGFHPVSERPSDDGRTLTFLEAELFEISATKKGAVPLTALLELSTGPAPESEEAARLARMRVAGELSSDEYHRRVDLDRDIDSALATVRRLTAKAEFDDYCNTGAEEERSRRELRFARFDPAWDPVEWWTKRREDDR